MDVSVERVPVSSDHSGPQHEYEILSYPDDVSIRIEWMF